MIYNIMSRLDRVVLGRRKGIYTDSRGLIRQTHDPSIHRIRSLLPIILMLIQTTVTQVCCLFTYLSTHFPEASPHVLYVRRCFFRYVDIAVS